MNFENWSPLTLLDRGLQRRIQLAYAFDRLVLFITNDDVVLGCGINDSGCLGVGDMATCPTPSIVTELHKKGIKAFAFGGSPGALFVVAYTYSGDVYTWGRKCGLTTSNHTITKILKPTLIKELQLPRKIKEISCGSSHCLVLNVDGEVHSWGDNGFGQLGHGSVNPYVVPAKIMALATNFVVKISCGGNFSAAILENGELYTWGDNTNGQLGNTSQSYSSLPIQVIHFYGNAMKRISCGYSYVLAINKCCQLYVWGSNQYGELGLRDITPRSIPVENKYSGKVFRVAATHFGFTSAALTENWKVLMWGKCSGLNILEPKETEFTSLNEVFANFSDPRVMFNPMKRKPTEESITEAVENSFDDMETSDLVIVAEDEKIFVHRVILKIRSNYFKTFLQEYWIKEDEKYDKPVFCGRITAIVIKVDQSYSAMRAYLRYLYTGKFDSDFDSAVELFILAHEYDDKRLKYHCEKVIRTNISIENAAILYPLSLKMDENKLQKIFMAFVCNHLSEFVVSPEFLKWDLETVQKFLRACHQNNVFQS